MPTTAATHRQQPAASLTKPRRRPASIHLLSSFVMPCLPDGVPLAFAAAGPQLRLCAETHRADDSLRTDARTGALVPRTLGETADFTIYEAKAVRRCGVRVGLLIITLHLRWQPSLHLRRQSSHTVVRNGEGDTDAASNANDSISQPIPAPPPAVLEIARILEERELAREESHHHYDDDCESNTPASPLLPAAPSLTAADMAALHAGSLLPDAPAAHLRGHAAIHHLPLPWKSPQLSMLPTCTANAGQYPFLTTWARSTADVFTITGAGKHADAAQRLIRARCDEAEGRFQRRVAEALAWWQSHAYGTDVEKRRGEGSDGRSKGKGDAEPTHMANLTSHTHSTTAADDDDTAADTPATGRHKDGVTGLPLQRGLHLWAKAGTATSTEPSTECLQQCLALTQWWLRRPLSGPAVVVEAATEPRAGNRPLRSHAVPIHLHLYAADTALVEIACHAICDDINISDSGHNSGSKSVSHERSSAPNAPVGSNKSREMDQIQRSLLPSPWLEGLSIIAAPQHELRLRAPHEAPLLSREQLSHMRVLELACQIENNAIHRILSLPDAEDIEEGDADNREEAHTWTPRLEVLRLPNYRIGGVLAPLTGRHARSATTSSSPASLTGLTSGAKLSLHPLLPALAHLDLSFSAADNSTVASIGRHCSGLATLQLHGCQNLTSLGGLVPAPNMGLTRTLWSLDVGSTLVDAAGIAQLPALTVLTHLSLLNCAALTDVRVLPQVPALRKLDLRYTPAVLGLDQLHVCRQLMELLTGGSGRAQQVGAGAVTATGFFDRVASTASSSTPLAASVPDTHGFAALTRLALDSVSWFNNDTFTALVRCAPPLVMLTLSALPRLSSLNALARESAADNGQQQEIGHKELPLNWASNGLQASLETLVLCYSGALTTDGLYGLAHCNALREIQVHSCPAIGDVGVLAEVPTLRLLSVTTTHAQEDALGGPVSLAAFETPYATCHGSNVNGQWASGAVPRQLEMLFISDSAGRRGLPFLVGMPRLRVLDLSDTAVTSESLSRGVEAHLAAVASVRSINAYPAAACDGQEAHLPSMLDALNVAVPSTRSSLIPPCALHPSLSAASQAVSTLHTLVLDYCESLTDVSSLARVPSLCSLSLVKTPVTDDGIQEILFSPTSGLEALDLTGCAQLTLQYDVARLVHKQWAGTQGNDNMRGPHEKPPVCGGAGWAPFSRLQRLRVIGLPALTNAALTALFSPIPPLKHDAMSSPAPSLPLPLSQSQSQPSQPHATYFRGLTELDAAQCRRITSVEPLLPLAGTLRSLCLRFTCVSAAGLQRVHELSALTMLDLQDTTRLGDVSVAITHPSLRSLDIRGASDLAWGAVSEEVGSGDGLGCGRISGLVGGEDGDDVSPASESEEAALRLPDLAPLLATNESQVMQSTSLLRASLIEDLSITPSMGHLEVLLPVLEWPSFPAATLGSNRSGEKSGEPEAAAAAGWATSDDADPNSKLCTLPNLCRLKYSGPLAAGERTELMNRIAHSRPLLVVHRR